MVVVFTHCDANELYCLSSLLIGGEGFPKVNEVPLNWKSEICENEARVSSEAFGGFRDIFGKSFRRYFRFPNNATSLTFAGSKDHNFRI